MLGHPTTNLVFAGAIVILALGGLLALGTLMGGARRQIDSPTSQPATNQPPARDLQRTSQALVHDAQAKASIGKPAPAFSLDAVQGGDFRTIQLSDYRGKWLILFFYPLDFTFVCPTEICAISDRAAIFRELGAEIVGVSIDSKFSHYAWMQQPRNQGGIEGLKYPLLSDINKQMSRDYGVLSDEGVALRGLFLIDPDGVLQHATINNLAVGRNVDEILRVLQAFQYVREHGEVCPANWEPGRKTMIPDVHDAKAYFSVTN
jgi:peroxiredoxin (alkyl hydroperoxide reductase subunit C)